jgi:hypothetical protein
MTCSARRRVMRAVGEESKDVNQRSENCMEQSVVSIIIEYKTGAWTNKEARAPRPLHASHHQHSSMLGACHAATLRHFAYSCEEFPHTCFGTAY